MAFKDYFDKVVDSATAIYLTEQNQGFAAAQQKNKLMQMREERLYNESARLVELDRIALARETLKDQVNGRNLLLLSVAGVLAAYLVLK